MSVSLCDFSFTRLDSFSFSLLIHTLSHTLSYTHIHTHSLFLKLSRVDWQLNVQLSQDSIARMRAPNAFFDFVLTRGSEVDWSDRLWLP